MKEKEKDLNCWNHPVLAQLKREIAANKLHLNILLDFARKPIIHKEKKKRFRRLPRNTTFWWESVWNNFSDDRFA